MNMTLAGRSCTASISRAIRAPFGSHEMLGKTKYSAMPRSRRHAIVSAYSLREQMLADNPAPREFNDNVVMRADILRDAALSERS